MSPMVSSGFSVSRIRKMNSYEVTGFHQPDTRLLDEIIIDHLTLVREMATLNANEIALCRMIVEGYSTSEMAAALRVSERTTRRMIEQIRWSLYGINLDDARRKGI